MNKKRLIAFGCSYPFGHGLPDCIGHIKSAPGENPSLMSYPSLIAQSLGRDNVNLSLPGTSNKAISYKVYNFQFEKDDLVLLSWTHSERSMIALDDETLHIIGPWCNDKLSKLYYKNFYTNTEDMFSTELYYSATNYFLLNKVKKVINTPPFLNYSENKIELEKYNFLKTDKHILDFKIDLAADDLHPGVKSNKKFALYLLDFLDKNKGKNV